MKKSISLLSALILTTTVIVNCQKAPEKRRVRPAGGSGSPSDVADEKAKLPTQVCKKEISDLWRDLYTDKEKIKTTKVGADTSDADKDTYSKLGVRAIAKCDDVLVALRTQENEGCFLDAGVKSEQNALTAKNIETMCKAMGKKLFIDVQLDSSYYQMTLAEDKAKEETKKVHALVGKEGTISESGLALLKSGNTNLGQFLVEGEVKSAQVTLDSALAASKTVCTFIGKGVENEVQFDKAKLITIAKADEASFKDIGVEYNKKSTVLTLELSSEEASHGTMHAPLLCINMDSEKLSLESMKAVFGSVISFEKIAEAVVAEEVVKEEVVQEAVVVQEEPVKAEPTKVEEKAVEVKEEKAVEIKEEPKEEEAPAQAVPAAVDEKSTRLEAEAQEAAAEYAKLQTDRAATVSDLQDAELKAKKTREAADSAKN